MKISVLMACALLLGAANVANATAFTSDFETGMDGWAIVNGAQTNKWKRGTARSCSGSYSMYVSASGTYGYSTSSPSIVHFYRQIDNAAGTLSFSAIGTGESGYDYVRVSVASSIPGAGNASSGIYYGGNYSGYTSCRNMTINIPAGGGTRYLIFTWRNDQSMGGEPVAIDNITYSSATSSTSSISITGATIAAKTYNGATTATVTGVTFSGLVSGTPLTLGTDYTATATFNNANAGSGKTVTVNVTMGTTTAASRYTLSSNSFSLTGQSITPKGISVAGATVAAKPYDGTTTATVTGVTLSGLANSETLSLGTDYTVAATFNNANAGSGKPVTVNVALTNTTKASNYTFSGSSSQQVTGTITPRSISVAGATIAAKTYDGATAATVTGVTFSGLPSGASLALGTDYTATAAFNSAAAGSGKTVTGTVALSTANYTLSSAAFSLSGQSIAKRSISVAGATIAAKTYDGGVAATVTEVTFGGLPSGASLALGTDYTATASFDNANAGSGKTVTGTVALSTAASANYTLGSGAFSLSGQSIAKKSISVTGAAIAAKTYDGGAAATVTEATFSGLPSGASLALGTDYTATAAFDSPAAGSGKTVTGTVALTTNAANYTLGSAAFSLSGQSIAKKDISVAGATAATKEYDGNADATVIVAFDGLQNGEILEHGTDYTVANALFDNASIGDNKSGSGTVALTTTSDRAKNYTLVGSGSVSFTGGSITKRSISIDGATVAPKTYDGATTATVSEVTFGKLLGSDALALGTDYTATAAFDSPAAGDNKAGSVTVVLASNDTYTLPASSGRFTGATINKKDINIAGATVAEKIYDGSNLANVTEVAFEGLVSPDALALGEDYTVSNAAFADAAVGSNKAVTYTVALNEASATAASYNLPNPNGSATGAIKQSGLTITGATIADKVFDGATTATVEEVQLVDELGESPDLTLGTDYTATASFGNAEVGEGKPATVTVTLTGAATSYTLASPSYTGATGTVEQRRITLAGADVETSKGYDGTTSAKVNGLTFGNTVESYPPELGKDYTATAAYDDEKVGDGKTITVAVSFFPTSSYVFLDTTFTVQGSIAKQAITFDTAYVAPKTYDGSTEATVDSVRFKLGDDDKTLTLRGEECGATASFDNQNAGTNKTAFVAVDPELIDPSYELVSSDGEYAYPIENQEIKKISLAADKLSFAPTEAIYNAQYQPVIVSTTDDVPYTGGYTVSYNGGPTQPRDAGEYSIVVKIEGNESVDTGTFALGVFTIVPDTIKIKDVSIELDKVYDGTDTVPGNGTASFVRTASEETSATPAGYTLIARYDGSVEVGSGKTITATVQLSDSNYRLSGGATYTKQGGSITRRDISVDSAIVAPKVYDGTADATVQELLFANLAGGDTLKVGRDYTILGSSFDNEEVGNQKTVTLFVLLQNQNYNLPESFYTSKPNQVILPLTPTREDFAFEDTTATYTGEPQGATVTLGGRFSDSETVETVAVSYSGVEEGQQPVNVGSYKVSARVVNSRNIADKSFDLGEFTINPKQLSVDTVYLAEKIYDATADVEVVGVKFDSLVNGEQFALNEQYTVTATLSDVGAGNRTATATVKLADGVKNYALKQANSSNAVQKTQHFAIKKRPLTVDTADVAPKTYDGTAVATVSKVQLSGFATGETLSSPEDYTVAAAFDNPRAGVGKSVTLSVALTNSSKAQNYELANEGKRTLQHQAIAAVAAPEVAKSADSTIVYNGEEHAAQFALSLGADSLVQEVTYNDATALPVQVGSYVVKARIEGGNNFSDTTLTVGELTIVPDTIRIDSIYVAQKVYDGTNVAKVDSVTFKGSRCVKKPVMGEDYTAAATFNDEKAGADKQLTITVAAVCPSYWIQPKVTTRNGEILKRKLYVDTAFIVPKTYSTNTTVDVDSVWFKDEYGARVTLKKFITYRITSSAFDSDSAGDNKTVTLVVALGTETAKNNELVNSTYKLKGQRVSKAKLAASDIYYDASKLSLPYTGQEQELQVAAKYPNRLSNNDITAVKYNGKTDKPVEVGAYGVTVDVSGNNYEAVTDLLLDTLRIVSKPISIQKVFVAKKIYDETPTAKVDSVYFTGTVNETLKIDVDYTATANFTATAAGVHPLTYTVNMKNPRYHLTETDGEQTDTIAKRRIAVTGVIVAPRSYDGKIRAQAGALEFGKVGDDPNTGYPSKNWHFQYTFEYTFNIDSAKYDTPTAGSPKTVFIKEIALIPSNISNNYVLTNATDGRWSGPGTGLTKRVLNHGYAGQAFYQIGAYPIHQAVKYDGEPKIYRDSVKHPYILTAKTLYYQKSGEAPTATAPVDTGKYTVTVTIGNDSNFSDISHLYLGTLNIGAEEIRIIGVDVVDKYYDGGREGEVARVVFAKIKKDGSNGDTVRNLTIGAENGYTATAYFADTELTDSTSVAVTVALNTGNYLLANNKFTAKGKIVKSPPQAKFFELHTLAGARIDSLPYDGKPYFVVKENTEVFQDVERTFAVAVKSEYADAGIEINSVVYDAELINVGAHAIGVRINAGENFTKGEVDIPFTIHKVAPKVAELSFSKKPDATYSGQPNAFIADNGQPTWKSGVPGRNEDASGISAVSYTTLGEDLAPVEGATTTVAPTNAGTYAVSVDIAESASYRSARLALDTFVVNKKTIHITGTSKITKAYDGTDTAKVTAITPDNGDLIKPLSKLSAAQYVIDSARFVSDTAGKEVPLKIYSRLIDPTLVVNYRLESPYNTVADVAKKKITIAGAKLKAKSFDNLDTAVVDSVWFKSLVVKDDPLLRTGYTIVSAKFSPSHAAGTNRTAKIHVALTGDAAKRYVLPEGKDSINLKNQTIELAIPDTSHLDFTIDTVDYNGAQQRIQNVAFDSKYGDSFGAIEVYYNGDTTPPTNIGSYGVTVTIAKGTNFEAVSLDNAIFLDTFVIRPGAIDTIIVDSSSVVAKPYDGTTTVSFAPGGLKLKVFAKKGDSEEAFSFGPRDFEVDSAWYNDATVGNKKTVSIRVLPYSDLANKYITGNAVFTVDKRIITPRKISIDTALIEQKYYDGKATAKVDSLCFSGLAKGDTLKAADYTTVAAYFSDSSAGSNKTLTLKVKLNDAAEGGSKALNYTLGGDTTRIITKQTISKKTISIDSVYINKKPYDGTDSALKYVDSVSFTELVTGDTLKLGRDYAVKSARFDSVQAGTTRKVYVRLSLADTAVAKNYTLSSELDTVKNQTIIKTATPTKDDVVFAKIADAVYDGKPHTTVASWKLAGDTIGLVTKYTNSSGASVPAPTDTGVYYVSAVVTARALNFSPGTVELDTFTIVPDTISVIGATVAAKIYDRTDSATVTGATFTSTTYGAVPLTLATDYKVDSAKFDTIHAATNRTVTVWISLGASGKAKNYVLKVDTCEVKGQSIARRPLTIAGAKIAPKYYDGTDSATVDTVWFNNLVQGDLPSWVVDTAKFSDPAVGTKAVFITLSLPEDSAVNRNYYLTSNKRTENSQKILLGTPLKKHFVVGDYEHTIPYDKKAHTVAKKLVTVAEGVGGMGKITKLLYVNRNTNVYTANATDAGIYSVEVVVGVGKSYVADTVALDTLVITPDTLAITSATFATNKTYDGLDTAAGSRVNSVKFKTAANKTLTLTAGADYRVDSVKYADKNAGENKTARIYVSLSYAGESAAKNYALSNNPFTVANATIARRSIKIDTAYVEPEKGYDGTTVANVNSSKKDSAVTFSNLVAGDTLRFGATGGYLVDSARYAKKDTSTDPQDVTIYVKLDTTALPASNYTLSSSSKVLTAASKIAVDTITIEDVVIAKKYYDGTDSATVEAINVRNSNRYALSPADYTASAKFDGGNANASTGRTVTVRVKLEKAVGYVLRTDEIQLKDQVIHPATPAKEHFNVAASNRTITYDGNSREFLSVAWKQKYSDTGSFTLKYADTIGKVWSYSAPQNVGTYYISMDVDKTGNFSAGNVLLDTVSITPRELTGIDTAIFKLKTYNARTTVTVDELAFEGVVDGDKPYFETGKEDSIYTIVSSKFTSPDAGADTLIVKAKLNEANPVAKNYVLKTTAKDNSLTDTIIRVLPIAKKALTITKALRGTDTLNVSIKPKVYDSTNVAVVADDTLLLTGMISGETVYGVVDSARFTSVTVGDNNKTVVIYASPYGKDSANYTIKTLSLKNQSIVKDTLKADNFEATPSLATTLVYVYDGLSHPVAVAVKRDGANGKKDAITTKTLYRRSDKTALTATAPKDTGTYEVKVAASGTSYNRDTILLGTITIVPDTLTIVDVMVPKVTVTRPYDGTDAISKKEATIVTFHRRHADKDTVPATKLYAVDSIKIVSGKNVTFDADADSAVKIYVSLKGALAATHVLATDTGYRKRGVAKVTPKPISLKTASITKTYDGTDSAKKYVDSVVFTGLVAGEKLDLNAGDYIVDSAFFSDSSAGDGKTARLYVSLGVTDKAKNYTLSKDTLELKNLSVAKRLISIDTAFVSKTYDGTAVATSDVDSVKFGAVDGVKYSGLAKGDTLKLGVDYKVDTAYFYIYTVKGGSNVILTVSLTASQKAKNYQLVNNVNLELGYQKIDSATPERKHFVITAGDTTVTYDGAVHTVTVGFAPGLTGTGKLTLSYSSADGSPAKSPKNAGKYAIWVRVAKGANFRAADSVYVGTLTILPDTISIASVTVAAKTYDGTPDANVTAVAFEGLVEGQTLKLKTDYVVDSAKFEDKNAGESKKLKIFVSLKLTSAKAINYVLDTNVLEMTASVAQRNLELAGFKLKPKYYDGTTTAEVDSVWFNKSIAPVPADTALLDTAYRVVYAYFTPNGDSGSDKKAVVRVALTGLAATNYNLQKDSVRLTGQAILTEEASSEESAVASAGGSSVAPLAPPSAPETGLFGVLEEAEESPVPPALNSVIINGEELEVEGDVIHYSVPCGAEEENLQLVFNKKSDNIISNLGDTLLIPVNRPSYTTTPLTFTLADGRVKEYSLQVEKPFDFSSIVHVQLGGRMLLVIKNPENNGGYDFQGVAWQRKVGEDWLTEQTGKFYYVSPDGNPITDVMRVQLQEVTGDWISTCPYDTVREDTPAEGMEEASVYPNPIASGEKLQLKLDESRLTRADLEKIYTAIYLIDVQGRVVFFGTLSDLYNGLTMSYAPGVYHLIFEGKSARKAFKISVTK
ncbi:MAG: YDG domain-containing protein [Prevotellaceae bacterium]|nr:YDG domain-containing protein [Prevotellaceae bacterium]